MNARTPERILIVEDSPTQALWLQTVLESEGYRCSIEPNGAAGLRAVQEQPPDLIISDIVMPEVDGYELCRRIKKDPKLQSIPLILLTSLANPENILAGLDCGADNFFIKPFERESLVPQVRYILSSRAACHEFAKFGLEVALPNGKQTISTERAQMLDALFASCEAAAKNAAEMRRARDAAERASAAKTELLARIGHELRNPLHAILGFAQLLEMEAQDENTRDSVEQIKSAGERLLRLAEEMLDVSQVESGRLLIQCEPITWQNVVRDSVRLIEPMAKNRRIEVHCMIRLADECRVIADARRLGEVLLNLLSNAVKYNRDGGSILIEAECREGEVLRIKVTDEGMGIAEDKLARLFTPYDRLGAEEGSVEGVGLGLVLAKTLMEAMGGAIGVDTDEGAGSTFWIDLPTHAQGTLVAA